jgi:hypothetical protein
MSYPKYIVFDGVAGDVYIRLGAAACVEFRHKSADDKLRGVSVLADNSRIGPLLADASEKHLRTESHRFQRAIQRRKLVFELRAEKKK